LRIGLTFLLVLLMLLPIDISAQPEVVWNKTYGGPGHDLGGSILEAVDGGYVQTGLTESYGAGMGDVWLLKTDAMGSKLWDNHFGGSGIDVGTSLRRAEDDGYIITGYTTSYGAGGKDIWLIKTDSEGNKEWDRTFGGLGSDVGSSIWASEGDEYIILGNTDSYGAGKDDVWLIKVDSKGSELWNRTFGGPGDDSGRAVMQTGDGGYIMVATTDSFGAGDVDVWLIKTDSNGTKEWDRTFGGVDHDGGRSVQETDDGYAIAGFTKSYGTGDFDVWLLKTDSEGREQWNRTFGGSIADFGNSLYVADDGGFIVTGSTSSEGIITRPDDALLIKTDSKGREEWQELYAESGNQCGISVLQAEDGSYIVAGFTNHIGAGGYDFWIINIKDG
jgi:predicted secreted protein